MARTHSKVARMWKVGSFLACLLAVAACDDPVNTGQVAPNPAAPVAPVAPVAPEAPVAAVPIDAAVESDDEPLRFVDDDFVELDVRNRDPFRNFVSAFRPVTERGSGVQRTVIMPTTPVEDLRLIAIVSGISRPRAMLQDSTGVGFVVTQNDYVGREEVLQSGGSDSMPITLNWQVARIRPGEVVLTRTDPSAPDRPPLTRTIVLHDEEELAGQLTLQ